MSLDFLAALGAIVLIVTTGLLAGCEVMLAHTTRARASTLADEGAERGDALSDLLSRRQSNLLAVVTVRIAAQVGAVALFLTTLSGRVEGLSWLPVVGGSFLVMVLAEALVKTVVLVRAEQLALRLVPVAVAVSGLPGLRAFGEVVSRAIRHRTPGTDDLEERPHVSEEELLAFAEVAVESAAIESEERALIESIIEFGDTIVREVMVPRPDMVTVEVGWRVSEVMEVVILNGLSRIPVIDAGIDDVVGIAYAKDLMRAERDGRGGEPVGSSVRDARFVPEQQRVAALLREMQAEQFHMAVVVDEYGGVAGLVTLEDLIEELVGEIVDEYDVEDPMAEPLPGGAYRVNARMPIDEVNDLLDATLPEGDWDTIGGLLFGMLGHIPTTGESIAVDGHLLTAARVQGRRIGLVRIERVDDETDGGQA